MHRPVAASQILEVSNQPPAPAANPAPEDVRRARNKRRRAAKEKRKKEEEGLQKELFLGATPGKKKKERRNNAARDCRHRWVLRRHTVEALGMWDHDASP